MVPSGRSRPALALDSVGKVGSYLFSLHHLVASSATWHNGRYPWHLSAAGQDLPSSPLCNFQVSSCLGPILTGSRLAQS